MQPKLSQSDAHTCMSWRPLARLEPPSLPLSRIRWPKPLLCTVPAWWWEHQRQAGRWLSRCRRQALPGCVGPIAAAHCPLAATCPWPLTVHAVHFGLENSRGLMVMGGIGVGGGQRNVGAAGEAAGAGVDNGA
jgi:hypothetical protein